MFKTYADFRLWLRRFRFVHAPLRWVSRTAWPFIGRQVRQLLRVLLPSSIELGLAKGWYSDLALLGQHQIEGRVILTDQGSPKIPTPSILILCGRKQHLDQPWPVFWSRHKHARLVGPSLAHINREKQLCMEAAYGEKRVVDDPAFAHFSIGRPLELAGQWTSVISRWVSTNRPQPYAHWLLDALPRLAPLAKFPPDTRILVPPHGLRYQTESLSLLGLAERCRPTSETHLHIEDYYFSAPTSMIVCYNPYAVEFLRARFLPLRKSASGTAKRFFLRRTTYGRNMTNEAAVLEFFRQAGWSIVDSAAMGFLEQIELFSQAEAICAIHGSGTANIVWCQPGCKVLELFADQYLAGDQEWISQCIKLQYEFMIFPSDHKLSAQVDLPELKRKLVGMGML